MKMRLVLVLFLAAALGPGGGALRAADAGGLELGVRGVLTVADGTPANDIPGFGLFARLRLGDRWSLGGAIDRAEYDFEQPARLLGLEQDPSLEAIDALAESTVASAWLERAFGRGGPTAWYSGAGVGFATIDVPDASGPLRDGGSFDVRTEADTEVIPFLVLGLRRDLGRRWRLDFGLRAEQHLADWRLEDRISGRRATIDDYTTYGGNLGVSWRFR